MQHRYSICTIPVQCGDKVIRISGVQRGWPEWCPAPRARLQRDVREATPRCLSFLFKKKKKFLWTYFSIVYFVIMDPKLFTHTWAASNAEKNRQGSCELVNAQLLTTHIFWVHGLWVFAHSQVHGAFGRIPASHRCLTFHPHTSSHGYTNINIL